MNVISDMQRFSHPTIPDITVYAWEDIRSGKPQDILVDVAPDGVVPLHAHTVDAKMIIVSGEASVLFDQDQLHDRGQVLNRETVHQGDIVHFHAGMRHGFRASSQGLTFLSINGGIVDQDPDAWDLSVE